MRPTRAALCAGVIALSLSLWPARTVSALPLDRLPSQYVHRSWDETRGLPQNTVYAIARDGDARLYLATEEGLVEWNGSAFRIYDKRSHPELRSSGIRALAPRPEGGVWLATIAGEVCSFDAGRLVCIPPETGLPEQYVPEVALREGSLFVCGSEGVFRVDEPEHEVRVTALSAHPCRAIAFVGDRLFAGGSDGLFVRRSDGDERVVTGEPVTALMPDRAGNLFVATGDQLARIDAREQSERLLGLDEMGRVNALRLDVDGALLVGAERGLFHRSEAGELTRLSDAQRVFSVLPWDAGHLFFGAGFSGLHLLAAGAAIPYGGEEGLPAGPVSAVAVGSDGRLWIGTFTGELVCADVVTRTPSIVGRWTPGDADLGPISAIAPDDRGGALVGSARGLFRVAAGILTQLDEAPVIAIARAPDEALVSFAGRRLERFPEGATQGEPVSMGAYEGDALVLQITASGAVYVGGDSLGRVGRGATELEPMRLEFPGMVYALAEDDDGTLWIGSSHDGLRRMRDGRTEHVTMRRGLHDDTLYALLPTRDGDAFVSASNRGLVVYPRAALDEGLRGGTVRGAIVIDTSDGMRSRECNGPAGARDRSGGLWFPTVRGVVRLAEPTIRTPAPSVVLDRVAVDGTQVSDRARVVIAPGARELAVDLAFAPLVLAPWARYEYSFGLEDEREDELVDLRGESNLRIVRPAPGDYVLRVRGVGRDGAAGPVSRLRVRVEPRVIESTWFRALVVIAIALAIAIAVGARIATARRRERELERIVRTRTNELRARSESLADALERLSRLQAELLRAERLAATATLVRGIAHELSNPLGMISGNVRVLARYAEFLVRAARALREHAPPDDDALRAALRLSPKKGLEQVATDLPAVLEDIDEGLRRAMLIVSDLGDLDRGVEARAVERTSIARAISGSRRMLGARAAGPAVEVDCPDELALDTYAGLVEQLLTNLLSNALDAVHDVTRDDGAALVRVVARAGVDDGIELRVIDRGPGMAPDVLARATEPFFTTKLAGRGTGLGLSIVAALARSAGGQLVIESEPGRGTTVTAMLPSRSVDSRRSPT